MPKFDICLNPQKNFDCVEPSENKQYNNLLDEQLSLAEQYIKNGSRKAAKYALIIVSILWQAEKPEEVKERYKNAVNAYKSIE